MGRKIGAGKNKLRFQSHGKLKKKTALKAIIEVVGYGRLEVTKSLDWSLRTDHSLGLD